jgi:hypothetical protein
MSQSLKNIQTLRPIIDPAAYPWLADPTGTADATAAFNAAFAAARVSGAEVRPTPGTYNFLGSLNPAGVALIGPEVYTREVTDYETRGVVFLHNGSGPMFAPQIAVNSPTAAGWKCEGITFFDPNQTGVAATPVVRPPLIEPVVPGRFVEVTFQNNIVINCYTFLRIPPGSLAGDVRILNNRIYAIAFLFVFEQDIPDVLFVSGNMFSPGVYQSFAVFTNAANLAKWSAANAVAWAVNITSGDSIDGFKSCNNIYFCFYGVFVVDGGRIDVSTSTGDNFDAVSRLVLTRATGGIEGLTISGGSLYSYQFEGPGATLTIPSRAFELLSSGDCKLTVSGLRCEVSTGDWLVDAGTGTNTVDIDSYMGPYGTAAGLTGDRYAFRIDNPNAQYNIRCSKIAASYAEAIGISVAECAELLVTGVVFNSLGTPVVLESTIDVGARITFTGCMSRNTTGAKSVQSAAPVGVAFDCGSRWDATSDITPSV